MVAPTSFALFARILSYFQPWQRSTSVLCLSEKQINLMLTWQTSIPILSLLLLVLLHEKRVHFFSFLTLTLITNASIVQMLFLVCCQAYRGLFWLFLLIILHLLPLSRPNLTLSYSRFRPTLIVWLLFTLPFFSAIVYLITHLHDHSKLTNLSLHLYFELIA